MDIQLKQKKGLKKKHIPYILGGVLLLFILWLILGDHSSTLVIDSRTITVGTARNDLFNDYIRVNGTVQPITILQLSPLEGGVVEKRNIEEGNTVKEGDVILTLSNQNLSASVLESESQLADRVNALRNAQIQMEQDRLNQQKEQFATDLDIQRKKRQYQQKEKLYNEKLIAREEYLQAKEDYELVERSRELIIERQKQDSLARAVQIDHLKEFVGKEAEEAIEMARSVSENGEFTIVEPGTINFATILWEEKIPVTDYLNPVVYTGVPGWENPESFTGYRYVQTLDEAVEDGVYLIPIQYEEEMMHRNYQIIPVNTDYSLAIR